LGKHQNSNPFPKEFKGGPLFARKNYSKEIRGAPSPKAQIKLCKGLNHKGDRGRSQEREPKVSKTRGKTPSKDPTPKGRENQKNGGPSKETSKYRVWLVPKNPSSKGPFPKGMKAKNFEPLSGKSVIIPNPRGNSVKTQEGNNK